MQKDTARLRVELDTLAEHATELGRLRGEAMAESERLKLALTAQEDLRAKLENELRAKQATADLLERSVDRITDLGASLAALDEQMNGSAGGHNKRAAEPTVLHLSDFVATVAADDEVAAAAPRPLAAGEAEFEALPMHLQLDDEPDQDIVDIGEPTDSETNRKLIITIGGEAFHYPLVKEHMTIGRGRGSDIRIASHFVSRVHAKINTDGGATIIEDAGSKNGITVNSERVLRRVLRDGDVINLGYDLDLRFVDADSLTGRASSISVAPRLGLHWRHGTQSRALACRISASQTRHPRRVATRGRALGRVANGLCGDARSFIRNDGREPGSPRPSRRRGARGNANGRNAVIPAVPALPAWLGRCQRRSRHLLGG